LRSVHAGSDSTATPSCLSASQGSEKFSSQSSLLTELLHASTQSSSCGWFPELCRLQMVNLHRIGPNRITKKFGAMRMASMSAPSTQRSAPSGETARKMTWSAAGKATTALQLQHVSLGKAV
jgi:hypothetical protein